MHESLFSIIEFISLGIGLIGIIIIFDGAFRGFWQYVSLKKYNCENARLSISKHLILGLDFLVAKDIIDTFLLSGKNDWMDLVRLVIVVGIRITLSHFLEKEITILRKRIRPRK